MKPETLGFIPARSGSKGVVGKNKRLVGGKPLIQWTIEAALASKTLSAIIVSTDDDEVAEISRICGVDVLKRPVEIARDTSPVIDAVRHAMSHLKEQGRIMPACVALLQPTAPLRTAFDIDQSVELFFKHGLSPVCSVVRCEDNHPARMYRKSDDGMLLPLFSELATARRQDLPPVFHRNGAVYAFGQKEIETGTIIGNHMVAYEMPPARSLNIDTEIDLICVQTMMATK